MYVYCNDIHKEKSPGSPGRKGEFDNPPIARSRNIQRKRCTDSCNIRTLVVRILRTSPGASICRNYIRSKNLCEDICKERLRQLVEVVMISTSSKESRRSSIGALIWHLAIFCAPYLRLRHQVVHVLIIDILRVVFGSKQNLRDHFQRGREFVASNMSIGNEGYHDQWGLMGPGARVRRNQNNSKFDSLAAA